MEIIKRFEGILDGDPSTVNLDPYLCPAGYWTIGWGHLVRNAKGKTVKSKKEAYSIYKGGITLQEAESLLRDDVRRFESFVKERVKVQLTKNQLEALTSFCFNVGTGNFNRSTLLRKLNSGDYAAVPSELKKWVKAEGKRLNGLVKRREAESELWNRT